MWSVIMRDREEKDRARLAGELYTPLPGQQTPQSAVQEGPWSDHEMAASFRAMQSRIGKPTS